MEINLSSPIQNLEYEASFGDGYAKQLCVVQDTNNAILLGVRWIGRFVDLENGELYTEAKLMEDDADSLVYQYPYIRQMFYVYKLDLEDEKWVPMENAGYQALLVGGNLSVSLGANDFPVCRNNSSIYDFWERINQKDCYMGVFSLEDGSLKEVYDCGWKRISPEGFFRIFHEVAALP